MSTDCYRISSVFANCVLCSACILEGRCLQSFTSHSSLNSFLSLNKILLTVAWVAGTIAGSLFVRTNPFDFVSVMRMLSTQHVSIVGGVICIGLPIFLSSVCVKYLPGFALCVIAFVKAFTYFCCLSALVIVYGQAGWLVRWLFFFSDSCSVPVLIWFWYRNIDRKNAAPWKDLRLCVAIGALILCIDYFVVSQFSMTLFHY